ncbi:DsrE family protein [Timonella sp. A28]|uniref:DsrE family protein n=1 Tax=Timonella sp. A28 TaxID=3442640 RepID=UPI003EC10571
MSSRALVIKSTTGLNSPETTNQALTVATAALAAGVPVSVWLTGDSSFLAVPGRAAELSLEHAPAISDLIELIVELGSLTVCSQCAARRGLTTQDLIPGVRIAGAPVFVEEIMAEGVQALVY